MINQQILEQSYQIFATKWVEQHGTMVGCDNAYQWWLYEDVLCIVSSKKGGAPRCGRPCTHCKVMYSKKL